MIGLRRRGQSTPARRRWPSLPQPSDRPRRREWSFPAPRAAYCGNAEQLLNHRDLHHSCSSLCSCSGVASGSSCGIRSSADLSGPICSATLARKRLKRFSPLTTAPWHPARALLAYGCSTCAPIAITFRESGAIPAQDDRPGYAGARADGRGSPPARADAPPDSPAAGIAATPGSPRPSAMTADSGDSAPAGPHKRPDQSIPTAAPCSL